MADKVYTVVPVYLPTEDGVSDIVLAEGSLGDAELLIKFNDKLPAAAIQRLIKRGVLVGLSFVLIKEEEDGE